MYEPVLKESVCSKLNFCNTLYKFQGQLKRGIKLNLNHEAPRVPKVLTSLYLTNKATTRRCGESWINLLRMVCHTVAVTGIL